MYCLIGEPERRSTAALGEYTLQLGLTAAGRLYLLATDLTGELLAVMKL